MGIRLLNRMMKVRKFRPKFAAPPSIRGRVLEKGRRYIGESSVLVHKSELVKEKCPKLLPANDQY